MKRSGSTSTSSFDHPEWASLAPGLKTIEDATEIRRRILIAFEAAEREADPERRAEWMTFVLVGGGPTGVELAGAIAEIAQDTLEPDLTVPGHPEIFVVGDAAVQPWHADRPTRGVAQDGMQGGLYARVIRRRVLGRPHEPFRYSNHGDVAVIGRAFAVTDIPWLGPLGQQGGFTAWMLWLLIHITYLIGFSNRVVVLVRWGWTFLTHGRGTRLITGSQLLPPIKEPEPPVLAPLGPDVAEAVAPSR